MADYIDREGLRNRLSESLDEARKVPSQAQWKTGLLRAMFLLQSMSSIEKHGHFIPNEFISTLGICSVCEHPIEDGDSFCKWCGAKMDEVTE